MHKIALALLAVSFAARAERPVIDLNGARVQAYPLAIAKAAGQADAGAQVLEVLSHDLERSSLFKVLDPRSFVADPAREGMTVTTIDFGKWTAVGAAAVVKSLATVEGGQVKVEFHLFDAARAAELLHGSYSAPRAGLRQIAHRFGDDVVRLFTQEPGVFQTRIAYVREAEGGKQIVVADSDGFGAQALTSGSINLLPAWSPDGRSIAFTTFKDLGGAHIYSIDVASRAVKPLVLMGDFATGASFAPDGARFAYSSSVEDNTDVYVSQADGAVGHRLTESRAIDISPSFSPDGKRLVFVSDRAGAPHLYTMTAEGGEVKRLTFQGNYNQEPAWSPKGDLIAFSGRDEHRVFDIYVINVATGKMARLTQNQGSNDKPSWSPNGRLLLFASTRTGKKQLFTMAPDGSNQRQVTDEKLGASDPAWGPLPR